MSDDKIVSINSKKSPEVNLQSAFDDSDASVHIIVGGEQEGLYVSGIHDTLMLITLLHDVMGIVLDADLEQQLGDEE